MKDLCLNRQPVKSKISLPGQNNAQYDDSWGERRYGFAHFDLKRREKDCIATKSYFQKGLATK